jgi:hypothetical protein
MNHLAATRTNPDCPQYLSVNEKRGMGKGKEKTFNPNPVTFCPNQFQFKIQNPSSIGFYK